MNFIKKFSPLVLGFILMAGSAFAQGQQPQVEPAEDVSDEELEMFVEIAMASQELQRDVSMQMQEAINNQDGITFQRFQMIQQSQQNPQMADSLEITEEEQQAMDSLQPKLAEIGQSAQTQMQSILSDSELSEQRLNAIQMALQTDQELMQRVQQRMMEMQQNSSDSEG